MVGHEADANLDASPAVIGEARRPVATRKPKSIRPSRLPRPSRFSIELTPERRERWQRAADIAIPDRERNLAPWLVPLIDMLAEIQSRGGDPLASLESIRQHLARFCPVYGGDLVEGNPS